jgi:hypothetical protein
MMHRWCTSRGQKIADLVILAPSAFGFTSTCETTVAKSCTMCKVLTDLKDASESFLICKEVHAVAVEQHAAAEVECDKGKLERAAAVVEYNQVMSDRAAAEVDYDQSMVQDAEAMEGHVNADNQVLSEGRSSQCHRVLELLTRLVATMATLVDTKSNTVADKFALIEKDEALVDAKATIVFNEANMIFGRHEHLKSAVTSLRAACNEHGVVTTRGTRKGQSRLDVDPTRVNTDLQSSPSFLDKLCDPDAIDACGFLRKIDRNHSDVLSQFYKHLKDVFGNASILNDTKEEGYRLKIEETVQGIIGWNVKDAVKQPTTQPMTELFAPGCESQEKDGVQPILYAIMVKMVQLLGLGDKNITREQGVAKVGKGKGRYVDFVVTPTEEYFLAVLPAMLGVPIEVKPISRKDTSVGQLLLEALNQVLGHLAKRVMSSFDFAGIGEDCEVFGLELTMGSVSVIILELSGVGTAGVKVTTRRTKRVPLFDKATREHLFGEMAKDVEDSFETPAQEELEMPAGFCLLARTLMAVQHGLGTSLMGTKKGGHDKFSMRPSLNALPVQLGRHMGSGAYSHAFELIIVGSTDAFVKVPKSHHMSKSLEREAEALSGLSHNRLTPRGHECIPKLYDPLFPIKTLDIKIRCESSALPCLPLRGLIGRATSQRHKWNSKDLECIFLKVYEALEYAHKHDWAHLDVRPSNIITRVAARGGGLKVLLIDWACAHDTRQPLKGFRGCPAFAHNQLFNLPKKCRPRLDHDLASLAYSLATLYHGGIPWSGFSNHRAVPVDARKQRLKMATEILVPLFKGWRASSREKGAALLKAIGSRKQRLKMASVSSRKKGATPLKAISHQGGKKRKATTSQKSPQPQLKRSRRQK